MHTETQVELVYVWDMYYHDVYNETSPVSPREAFQPLLDDFRSLSWLVTSPRYGLQTEWYWKEFPQEWPESFREGYEADYNVWKATRELASIYIDCGWQVNSVEQSKFRRGEFIKRRKHHLETVVHPLEEISGRVHRERRERENAENASWLSLYGQSVNPTSRVFGD